MGTDKPTTLKQLKAMCDAIDKSSTDVLNMEPGMARMKARNALEMDRAKVIENLKVWLKAQGI